ncbi:MAG: HemK/PrmC family methyltransferase [Candidatus Gastranaerophilaceae bacterium]
MNIKQIEKKLTEGGIEPNEAKIEAKMLVKHFLGGVNIYLSDDFECSEDLLAAVTLRSVKRIPIQYIIGTAYFMDEDFIVNENVLIPRDETEILVRKAVEIINGGIEEWKDRGRGERKQETWKGKREKEIGNWELVIEPFDRSTLRPFDRSTQSQSLNHFFKSPPNIQPPKHPLRVLDIGTGSGCIACIIAKLTDSQVLGVDISTDALRVALENSSKLGLFNKAVFRKSDIFSNINPEEKFDVIISNPPYIPQKERGNLQTEVGFEPESALFARDVDGIEFYEKIVTKATGFLNEGGYLMFELGINQSDKVKILMQNAGFENIEIEKDLAGIERVITGNRKQETGK